MMTNGVVHANVFGIKDWVTPYKISVLALLHEMTASKITLPERRRLNKLILPLQQGPDLTLGQFLETVEECCPQTAYAVKLRLHEMADGELKDMEYFFSTLPTPFTAFDSEAYKTSVVGLFIRHMLLAYNKLSFSQVYKLYKSLQHYYHSHYRKPGDEQDTMDATPSRGPLSQKQAEFFLARQAYLLKNDENKALKPAALQEEINNMLKFNPDFAEAHYLNYLNSIRVQDIYLSTHSLLHYFDRLILSGNEGKSNGDEGYGRSLRYAALNLASLHCRFGHYQQADLTLQEAVRIAQESSDHVCLQHCLSWLYTLEQMKGSDSNVLTRDSVKMSAHFCLPYLVSLGIQSLVQQGATQGKTAHKLMDTLKDTDILHWKHSLSELIEIRLALTTSIWRMYGKRSDPRPGCFAADWLFLMVTADLPPNHNSEYLSGSLWLRDEILQHLREQFPAHSQHAKLWMLCDLKIEFEKHMNEGKYHSAETFITAISALNKTEGLFRKAQVLKALNRSTEAYGILQRLQVHCEKVRCTEATIRVMLAMAELHWESSGFSTALPLLLQALALARQHHLQSLVSETVLHLAFTQLMLGVPEQALSVLHEAIEPVLAHGGVIDKGRALLLTARCQLSMADPSLAASAVDTLNEAAGYFSRLNCKERLRDVHYLQAQLHRSLGQTSQCNKSAMLFRLLDQELQTQAPPVSMRL
uniref:Anaphase-promoting complex subunit 5 n=1 Tax=Cynoglossus semilaevis TaxID=244447 RepID=A0A3P8WRP2_CYNSE